jgi:hypothetical protein
VLDPFKCEADGVGHLTRPTRARLASGPRLISGQIPSVGLISAAYLGSATKVGGGQPGLLAESRCLAIRPPPCGYLTPTAYLRDQDLSAHDITHSKSLALHRSIAG